VKKALFTLSVDNYSKDITTMTFPLMEKYAKKINAEFYIITEKKFNAGPAYEKLQIKEFVEKQKLDWAIFFDADTLIHPDMFDPTQVIGKDIVGVFGYGPAISKCNFDNYFFRDGRNLYVSSTFFCVSDWCLDFLNAYEFDTKDIISEVHTPYEEKLVKDKSKQIWIEEYVMSRNIARYGLKVKSLQEIVNDSFPKNRYYDIESCIFHNCFSTQDEKVKILKEVSKQWNVS
jgi:hypothetical protein